MLKLGRVFILGVFVLSTPIFSAKAIVVPESVLPSQAERMLDEITLTPESEFRSSASQDEMPVFKEERGPGTKFHLNDIKMDGRYIKDPNLRKFLQKHIGKGVSWAYLKDLERGLTRYFRTRGLFLAQVTLPAQEIVDGTVNYHLSPGYVDKIAYEGEVPPKDSLIAIYLNKIKETKPLSRQTLERYLLLLNDLPGMQAKINFSPSLKHSEASVMTVHLERKKIDASLSFNNDGTKYVGPWQGEVQASVNNLFHMEDRLTGAFGLSPAHDGMRIVRGSYEKSVGGNGLKLMVSGNHIQTKPGDYLGPLNMEGVSSQGMVGLKYPFVRSRYQNFWIDVQAGFNNSNNDVHLTSIKTRDRLRTAGITLTSDFSDVLAGKNLFMLTLTKGFRGLGATPDKYINSSRPVGYTDFMKATIKALRVQSLGRLQAVLLVEGQVASKTLLNAERFSMGGGPYNRAYPSGSYIGDKGIFARIELNYVFGAMGLVDHVIPYIYFTGGWASNLTTMANEFSHQTLRSMGFGVRTSLLSHVDGYVEYGIALKKKIYSGFVPSKMSVGLTVKY
jgi:hypothetical protein